MKLLSPAGDFESLKMAVFFGADEVYLGVKDFNARNIEGFSLDTLKKAVEFAHLFGVKVHLAVNILFSDNELQSALDLVVDAFNLGVDAFIIQDLGLAHLIHKHYPQVCIHASTQMGLHNLEGVQFAKSLGFSRVVLSRETPLDEIKRIKQNCDIEIEYFAQGALCVSFSGNCYLSAKQCAASGNRGKCKQLCRLPYEFFDGNKKIGEGYLLSAKDFCMIDRLKDLKDAGVDAIKIEGRARRPFYVGVSTREYRAALDGKAASIEALKLAFNRNFTAGYFDSNANIISNFKSHIGVRVGKIERVKRGKNFNEFFFRSNRDIPPRSTIKTFDGEIEKNTLSLFDIKRVDKNLFRATTTANVSAGQNVHLIVDAAQENELLQTTKKVVFDLFITANAGEKIKTEFVHKKTKHTFFGEVCEQAKNQALTPQNVIDNFSKSELFSPNIFVTTNNAFLTKSNLNNFRRETFEKIRQILTQNSLEKLQKTKIDTNLSFCGFEDFEIVENYDQKFNNKNVIYSPETYEIEDVKKFVENCKKQDKIPFLDTPNFALKNDIILLEKIVEKTGVGVVANNVYALGFRTKIVAGAGLNIFNHVAANFLGFPVVSFESGEFSYMEFPFMTLRHCPMKANLSASCDKCRFHEGYSYVCQNGKRLELKRKKLSSCTFFLT